MPVNIYSKKEISLVQHSGRIAYNTHMLLMENIRTGISTMELDSIAKNYIESQNDATPAFLGYEGYPHTICTSLNSAVVHGLPSSNTILKEGDIISIDLGVLYRGYYSDTAWTWPVGTVSSNAKKIITITQQCLYKAIKVLSMARKMGAVGEIVQKHAESNSLSVVRDLVGHGIGRKLHEPPHIPNFGRAKEGVSIKKGMVVAIEPMINEGTSDVAVGQDGWTYQTVDGKLSAHFEHTIAITESGPIICTLAPNREINVFKLIEEKEKEKVKI